MRFMTLKQIELTRNKVFLVIFSLLHLRYINFMLQVYHWKLVVNSMLVSTLKKVQSTTS